MSKELSSSNVLILNGSNIKDPETQKAIAIIAQWVAAIDEKVELRDSALKEKKHDKQYIMNIVISVLVVIETALLIIFH